MSDSLETLGRLIASYNELIKQQKEKTGLGVQPVEPSHEEDMRARLEGRLMGELDGREEKRRREEEELRRAGVIESILKRELGRMAIEQIKWDLAREKEKKERKGRRYTLYQFPVIDSLPRHFRWKWQMRLFVFGRGGLGVWEYRDHKTGEYHSYWI